MRLQSNAWRLVPAAVLALVLGSATAATAADATGTWKWTSEFNGNKFESTLKLKQEGEKVTGTMKRNEMEADIEDGKVAGETITFKVVRDVNGNKFVINYQGKVSADTIKGDIKIERDGETITREWEAKREK